jgi:hypothetical protein
MTSQITINEALVWMKTLRERHAELVNLRDQNSHVTTRRFGLGGDKDITIEPTYNVKTLDKMITRVAREIRMLEQQIKATNAVTPVLNYTQDEAVLGDLD